jgi:hypothetical protein
VIDNVTSNGDTTHRRSDGELDDAPICFQQCSDHVNDVIAGRTNPDRSCHQSSTGRRIVVLLTGRSRNEPEVPVLGTC